MVAPQPTDMVQQTPKPLAQLPEDVPPFAANLIKIGLSFAQFAEQIFYKIRYSLFEKKRLFESFSQKKNNKEQFQRRPESKKCTVFSFKPKPFESTLIQHSFLGSNKFCNLLKLSWRLNLYPTL